MAKWLDKYEQGGLILKKKTKDNYSLKGNANDSKVSVGPGFVGAGYDTTGRHYSPAWGGQFQHGGILGKTFLQPNDPKFPVGWNPIEKGYSTEYSTTIGTDGEYYLVPGFKHGKLLSDPEKEFRSTGELLGGPFKTIQSANDFANRRHKYVEKGQPLPSPMKTYDEFQMGGSMPGAVGFMYARTQNPAPANGKYTKKTLASAQNGQEMKYYQDGLDFKPKSISEDGINISANLKKEAEERLKRMGKPKATISQYTPKAGEAERLDREKLQRIEESYQPLNRFASSKVAKNLQDAGMFAADVMGAVEGIGAVKGLLKKTPKFNLAKAATSVEEDEAMKAAANTLSNPVITRGPINWWEEPGFAKRNPNYNPNLPPPNPFPKQTASDVPQEMMPYLTPNNPDPSIYQRKYAEGGIVDPMGQWAHPGEITIIPSNDITMEGVDYPVLGVSDTGDTKLMQPGKDYKFKGTKVTEYPMAQNGIITNDPKDPRIKAYQDSLNLYNKNKRIYESGIETKARGLKYENAIKGKPYGERQYLQEGTAFDIVKKPKQPVKYQEAPKPIAKTIKGTKKFFINKDEVSEDVFNKIAPVKHKSGGWLNKYK